MGLAKRGKSTLINALLGRKDSVLAPVDFLPATSVSTSFEWKDCEQIKIVVTFKNKDVKEISEAELKDYITEDGNPENKKIVSEVKIYGRFDERVRDITLVDLPGTRSIHSQHDQIVYKTLPESDAVILLSDARMPISAEEVEMLNKLRTFEINKVFFPINKKDKVSEEELSQCRQSNQKVLSKLGERDYKFYDISAKQAHEGNWETSGLSEFWGELSSYLAANRGKIIEQRFCARVRQALAPLLLSLKTQVEAAKLEREEIENKRNENAQEKKKLEERYREFESTFKLSWENRVSKFKTDEHPVLAEEIINASGLKDGDIPSREKLEGIFNSLTKNAFEKLHLDLSATTKKFNKDLCAETKFVAEFDFSLDLGDYWKIFWDNCEDIVGAILKTIEGFWEEDGFDWNKIEDAWKRCRFLDDITDRKAKKIAQQITSAIGDYVTKIELEVSEVSKAIETEFKEHFDTIDKALLSAEKILGNTEEIDRLSEPLNTLQHLQQDITA